MNRNQTLGLFFEENCDQFCKQLSRAAGSPQNAEDVVQEAFYRALKYWDSFDQNDEDKLKSWFTSILNNSLKDFQRQERFSGMNTDHEEEENEAPGPETLYIDVQDAGDILRELSNKSRPTRDILYLYYLREYNPREIVKVLDVSNKSVRMAVWRFKKDMEEKFGTNSVRCGGGRS